MSETLRTRFGGPGNSGTFFGAEAKVNLEGFGRLRELLSAQVLGPIVERHLEPIAEEARGIVRVKTGLLQSTIRTEVQERGETVVGRVTAGSTEAYYAPYQEFIHHPYLRPAWEMFKGGLREGIATDIARLLGGL